MKAIFQRARAYAGGSAQVGKRNGRAQIRIDEGTGANDCAMPLQRLAHVIRLRKAFGKHCGRGRLQQRRGGRY